VKRLSLVPLAACVVLCLASPLLAADKPAAKPAAAKPAAAPVDTLGMLEKAVAKDSTKFDNLYKLGVMYLDRDRVAEAIRVFTKANQLKPKDTKTIVNLGAAYDAAGQAAVAQTWYEKALAAAPNDSIAGCRLASSLYSQGKYPEAMDRLRDIIEKHPNAYCAYFTLGVAFADAGIYKDAIRMWQKVVQIAPDSPEAASAKESMDVLDKYVHPKPN
jgi:tetratricopeptide (TPR) repeat protein